MKLQKKQELVDGLREQFSQAKVVIVTDYKGLNVTAINALRRKLRENGAQYQVVKNTLLRRASEDNDVGRIQEHFTGPSAIAISMDDPVGPAKALIEFAKENDKLEIKGGVIGQQAMSFEQIKALADLPSREVLLATLLGAFNSLPTGLVRTLSAVPGGFVNVLQAIKDQKEAA